MASTASLTEDMNADADSVLDKLEEQIRAMENELADVRVMIETCEVDQRTAANPLLAEAKQLDAETNAFKADVPPAEEQEKDPGVAYFLAVGSLEKEIANLRDYNSAMDSRITANTALMEELNQTLNESRLVIGHYEKLVTEKENASMANSEKEMTAAENAYRLQLENDIRLTRQITSEIKLFMKEYINKVGTLEDGVEEDRVPLGLLLQKLWNEFNNRDKDGWLKIEELDFDVRDQDVAQLLRSEIIKQRPTDNAIQMVDFTMRF